MAKRVQSVDRDNTQWSRLVRRHRKRAASAEAIGRPKTPNLDALREAAARDPKLPDAADFDAKQWTREVFSLALAEESFSSQRDHGSLWARLWNRLVLAAAEGVPGAAALAHDDDVIEARAFERQLAIGDDGLYQYLELAEHVSANAFALAKQRRDASGQAPGRALHAFVEAAGVGSARALGGPFDWLKALCAERAASEFRQSLWNSPPTETEKAIGELLAACRDNRAFMAELVVGSAAYDRAGGATRHWGHARNRRVDRSGAHRIVEELARLAPADPALFSGLARAALRASKAAGLDPAQPAMERFDGEIRELTLIDALERVFPEWSLGRHSGPHSERSQSEARVALASAIWDIGLMPEDWRREGGKLTKEDPQFREALESYFARRTIEREVAAVESSAKRAAERSGSGPRSEDSGPAADPAAASAPRPASRRL